MKWLIISILAIGMISLVSAFPENGFDEDSGFYIHDGMGYELTDLGITNIYNMYQGGKKGKLEGVWMNVLSGNVGVDYLVGANEYAWTRWFTNYTNEDNKIVTEWNAWNNRYDLFWTQKLTFVEGEDVKMSGSIYNGIINISDFKIWWVQYLDEDSTLSIGSGQPYIPDIENSWIINSNETTNLSALAQISVTGSHTMNFMDLVNNNWSIDNFYLGSADYFGFPEIMIMALGTSHGDGVFALGERIDYDPDYTGEIYPTEVGDPLDEWSNEQNLKLDDGNRAGATVGDMVDTSNYSLGIPVGATITGIRITMEGRAGVAIPACQRGAGAIVGVELSSDGGSTFTSTGLEDIFLSSSRDAQFSLGNLTYLWGRAWNYTDFDNNNFVARLNYTDNHLQYTCGIFGETFFGPTTGADFIRINVAYETNVPPIGELNLPENASVITIRNVTMNVTGYEPEGENIRAWVFAENGVVGKSNCVVEYFSISAGNNLSEQWDYNVPCINEDDNDLIFLYHFDRRHPNEIGDTKFTYDWAGGDNNGSSNSGYTIETTTVVLGKSWEDQYSPSDNSRVYANNTAKEYDFVNFTIAGWFYSSYDGTGSDYDFITQDDGAGAGDTAWFSFDDDNDDCSGTDEIYTRIGYTDYVCSGVDLDKEKWYHLAATHEYNGSAHNVTIYVNGDLKNSELISYNNAISKGKIVVGANNNVFYGYMDEVGFWERVLTPKEVKELTILTDGTYLWYTNFTDGDNTYQTPFWEYTVEACDDWECDINCATNVSYPSNIDAGGNDIIFTGDGYVNFFGNVSDRGIIDVNMQDGLYCVVDFFGDIL